MYKKILLIGSQHGNERLGDALYAHLTKQRPELSPYITYVIGNPKAHKSNVRYIESDLNRSYINKNITYEQRRANKVAKIIENGNYDLVLDLHTTECAQPVSIITTANESKSVQNFTRSSSVQHVVYMPPLVHAGSLIGAYGHVVAIEVNNSSVNLRLLGRLCDDIDRYVSSRPSECEKKVYEIFDYLPKDELSAQELNNLVNFRLSTHGFYPILVGNNTYKRQTSYLGFKARAITTNTNQYKV